MRRPFQTRRLVLRQMTGADLDDLVRENPEVAGGQASDASRRWVEASRWIDPREGGAWAIVHRVTRQPVGMVTYFAREPGGPAEISYMLIPRWRGKGLGSEAVAPVIAHLMDDLGLERLFADVALGNRASIRLLERLNFTPLATPGEALTVGLEDQNATRWSLDIAAWRALSRPETAPDAASSQG